MDIDTSTVEVPGSAAAAGFGTDADGGTRFGASAGVNSALVLTEFSAGTLVFLAAKPLNCNGCNFNCNFLGILLWAAIPADSEAQLTMMR